MKAKPVRSIVEFCEERTRGHKPCPKGKAKERDVRTYGSHGSHQDPGNRVMIGIQSLWVICQGRNQAEHA